MKRTYLMVLMGLMVTVCLAISGCEGEKKKEAPAPITETPKATPTVSAQATKAAPQPVTPTPTVPTPPTPQPADTGGRIKVDNPIIDLGKMGPGKAYTGQFKFTNTGSGKLIISKVQSTCSCTVADLARLEYGPGEAGVVAVTYNSSGYAGPVEKHLYIMSNDPTNPRAELALKGNIELSVVAEPARLALELNKDNGGAAPIVLKSKDGKPFKILSINCSRNVVSADFDVNAEATEHNLKPKVDVKTLREAGTGVIEIRLSHPECNSITVPYEALAVYDISRPRIILQNVEPGQTISREVFIKNNYGQDFSIASVTCQNGTMKIASQEKQGSSLKLMIDVTIPPQTEKVRRYITDKLDIKMADGEVLTINCSGWYKV
jgi:hypothetical protein